MNDALLIERDGAYPSRDVMLAELAAVGAALDDDRAPSEGTHG